jgi:hypothetical protein
VRTELLGVTSIVRALNLDARCYNTLVDCFHSSAVKLDRLTALWTQLMLRLFPQKLCVNGRCVLVGDGIKIPKCVARCRPSSSCISSPTRTPSPNILWGTRSKP